MQAAAAPVAQGPVAVSNDGPVSYPADSATSSECFVPASGAYPPYLASDDRLTPLARAYPPYQGADGSDEPVQPLAYPPDRAAKRQLSPYPPYYPVGSHPPTRPLKRQVQPLDAITADAGTEAISADAVYTKGFAKRQVQPLPLGAKGIFAEGNDFEATKIATDGGPNEILTDDDPDATGIYADAPIAKRQVQPLPLGAQAICSDEKLDAEALSADGGFVKRQIAPLPLSADEIAALRAILANDVTAELQGYAPTLLGGATGVGSA